MDLNLPVTLAILVLALAMFAFANWRARQPSQPLKVRMIDYNIVQMLCLILLLLLLSHVVSLVTGHTFLGRRGF